MNTFYLIRHGDKIRLPGDPGLSELGQQQASNTAQYLSALPISEVHTSPFNRTKETAQIIAESLGLTPIENSLLIERMNWDIPGQPFEEFVEEWNRASFNPDFKPRSGDSVKETAERLETVIKNLSKGAEGKHIVLVTHGGTIRDFLYMFSDFYKDLFKDRKMEGVHECSITKVLVTGDNLSVEYFHKTDHLE